MWFGSLSEQHLVQLLVRLSMLDKREMELIADCHGQFDHCLGILQYDELDQITGMPEACPWASYVLKCGSVPWRNAD